MGPGVRKGTTAGPGYSTSNPATQDVCTHRLYRVGGDGGSKRCIVESVASPNEVFTTQICGGLEPGPVFCSEQTSPGLLLGPCKDEMPGT